MNSGDPVHPAIKVALGASTLALIIVATQVSMPLRAIIIALAVSDLIFLIILQLGGVLPDKRRD